MKNKHHYNLFYLNLSFVIFLFALIIITGIFGLYIITIKLPNGNVGLSNWANKATVKIMDNITFNNKGDIELLNDGVDFIDENRLWIQVFDKDGHLLLSKNTPENIGNTYDTYDLIKRSSEKSKEQYIDLKVMTIDRVKVICFVGYPIKLSQITMYVNQDHFSVGKNMIISLLMIVLLAAILIATVYNLWMSKKFECVINAIENILHRSYKKLKPTGLLGEINYSLNILQTQIVERDNIRNKDEKQKEEWIANITHDLKTPLSPITGYSELLKDSRGLDDENVRRYGEIIYKNSIYTEQLIEEMKLTYQLKNEILRVKKEKINIIRFMREIIIDILNDPIYESRKIDFYSDLDSIHICVDASLLKRAITNLILNSIIHNNDRVNIKINIFIEEELLSLEIADNGNGINEKDLENLFTRYYRGTNTEVQSAGTGLGLAIARQIIELNNGKIHAKSVVNEGTKFTIYFCYLD